MAHTSVLERIFTEFISKANDDAISACTIAWDKAYQVVETEIKYYYTYHHEVYLRNCDRTEHGIDNMTRDIMVMRSKCWRNKILQQEVAEYEAIIAHMIEPIINREQEII